VTIFCAKRNLADALLGDWDDNLPIHGCAAPWQWMMQFWNRPLTWLGMPSNVKDSHFLQPL